MKLVINSYSGTVNRQYFVQTFLSDIYKFQSFKCYYHIDHYFSGEKRKRQKETIKIIINKAIRNCRDYILER